MADPNNIGFITTSSGGTVKLTVIKSYALIATNANSDFKWSSVNNWGQQPVAAGQIAAFGTHQTGNFPLNLDISETIGGLLFNNLTNYSYCITASGGSTLTLSSGAGSGRVNHGQCGTEQLYKRPAHPGRRGDDAGSNQRKQPNDEPLWPDQRAGGLDRGR